MFSNLKANFKVEPLIVKVLNNSATSSTVTTKIVLLIFICYLLARNPVMPLNDNKHNNLYCPQILNKINQIQNNLLSI